MSGNIKKSTKEIKRKRKGQEEDQSKEFRSFPDSRKLDILGQGMDIVISRLEDLKIRVDKIGEIIYNEIVLKKQQKPESKGRGGKKRRGGEDEEVFDMKDE